MVPIQTGSIVKLVFISTNGLKSDVPNTEIDAWAECYVYKRFRCAKCGEDSGWQRQRLRIDRKKTYIGDETRDAEKRAALERELGEGLAAQIRDAEARPTGADRNPGSSLYELKDAQCPKCGHEQPWHTKADAKVMMGCGTVGTALGLVGVLVQVLGAEDIAAVLFMAGAIGVLLLLISLGLKLYAKTSASGTSGAEWSFTEAPPV